jgi:hypothetical protein
VIEEKPVLENIGTDMAKFHEMNITAKEKKNKNRKISALKRRKQVTVIGREMPFIWKNICKW